MYTPLFRNFGIFHIFDLIRSIFYEMVPYMFIWTYTVILALRVLSTCPSAIKVGFKWSQNPGKIRTKFFHGLFGNGFLRWFSKLRWFYFFFLFIIQFSISCALINSLTCSVSNFQRKSSNSKFGSFVFYGQCKLFWSV